MMDNTQLQGLFKTVDSKDLDAFMSRLSDDAVFRYGSQDPVKGAAAVREVVAGVFGMVRALKHRLLETWRGEGSVVCQGEVTYTTEDGRDVTVPFVNVFRVDGQLIREYLVYVDPTPLAG